MRRVLWLVLIAWFGAVACTVNTQATGAGSQPDGGGGSGGTGGTGGGTGGANSCFPIPGQKFCGGQSCPEKNASHGCASTSCAACALPNAINDCSGPNGGCGVQICNPGFSNCDGDASNGCEINTASDPHHCGGCSTDCFTPGNATNWACNQGTCKVSKCPTGKGDCNGYGSDGCEVTFATDANHCGFCGNKCNIAHATATCVGGKCTLDKCKAGWGDCTGGKANGCEQDIATDKAHCGDCGTVCSSVNGQPACKNGKCTIQCSPGYGNCDGNVKTGCETNLNTTTNHCGSCTNNCTTQVVHATATCASGACNYSGNCNSGWGDCTGGKADGCETDLNTTTNHCGSCSTNCNAQVVNATAICSGSACSYSGSCVFGWGDCDPNKANGCETDLSQNSHCGVCGNSCKSNWQCKLVSGSYQCTNPN